MLWDIGTSLLCAARKRWPIALLDGRAFGHLPRQRTGTRPGLIVDLPESRDPLSSFEAGYQLTEELIQRKRPFTAIMAFDDMTAFGAIRALRKQGCQCRKIAPS